NASGQVVEQLLVCDLAVVVSIGAPCQPFRQQFGENAKPSPTLALARKLARAVCQQRRQTLSGCCQSRERLHECVRGRSAAGIRIEEIAPDSVSDYKNAPCLYSAHERVLDVAYGKSGCVGVLGIGIIGQQVRFPEFPFDETMPRKINVYRVLLPGRSCQPAPEL